MALAALFELLTPAALETDFGVGAFLSALFDPRAEAPWDWVDNALMIAAIGAIEPLYVAGGFALYLNRRTTLEAWDLELRFRRLHTAPAGARGAASALCAVLALCAGLLVPTPAAEAAEPVSRQIIDEVLAAPEFQQQRTHKVWQPRQRAEQRVDDASSGELARLLQSLSASAAQLLRILAYAGLAVALFFALRFLWRQLRAIERTTDAKASAGAPEVVFGLDVRPESLPTDLAQLARASAATDPRLALSLLYRGALVTLIHRDRLPIEHGDTEADCVRRVERIGSQPLADYFAAIVAAWSQCAYGHRPPQPERIATLCAQWPQHFGAAPAARSERSTSRLPWPRSRCSARSGS